MIPRYESWGRLRDLGLDGPDPRKSSAAGLRRPVLPF